MTMFSLKWLFFNPNKVGKWVVDLCYSVHTQCVYTLYVRVLLCVIYTFYFSNVFISIFILIMIYF